MMSNQMNLPIVTLVVASIFLAVLGSNSDVDVPEIYISEKQSWNPHRKSDFCKDGPLAALGKSIGANPATFGEIVKAIKKKLNLQLSTESKTCNEGNDAVFGTYKVPDMERELSEWGKKVSVVPGEISNSSSLGLGTHIDHSYPSIGDLISNDSPETVKDLFLLAALLPISSKLDPTTVQLNQTYIGRRALSESQMTLDGINVRQEMAKAMLLFTSKTFAKLLSLLIVNPTGKVQPTTFFQTEKYIPSGGFTSSMMNVVDAFCTTFQYAMESDVLPEEPLCSFFSLVFAASTCRKQTWKPGDCSKMEYKKFTYLPECNVLREDNLGGKYADPAELPVILNFEDILPLQDDLPIDRLDAEGPQSFLLFRSIIIVMRYIQRFYQCGYKKLGEDLIPGWEAVHVIALRPDGSEISELIKETSIPIALVARPRQRHPEHKCQMLFSFRGTLNDYDIGIDLDFSLTPFLNNNISAHRGFVHLHNSIWPHVQSILDSFIEDATCTQGRELYITGHSLGGSVGMLLAMQIAYSYKDAFYIAGTTFGAPKFLNKAGVEWFKHNVNIRSVVFDLDPVAAAPCSLQSSSGTSHRLRPLRCPELFQYPFVADEYFQTPGRITLNLMDEVGGENFFGLHAQAVTGHVAANGNLLLQITIPPPFRILLSHFCAYACKLSMYCAKSSEEGWMCKTCEDFETSFEMKMNLLFI